VGVPIPEASLSHLPARADLKGGGSPSGAPDEEAHSPVPPEYRRSHSSPVSRRSSDCPENAGGTPAVKRESRPTRRTRSRPSSRGRGHSDEEDHQDRGYRRRSSLSPAIRIGPYAIGRQRRNQ